MDIYVFKKFGKYIPAYDSDHEKAKRQKDNELYKVKITQPRNIKFHKKYFALINMVFDNQEMYQNIEDMREEITIEAGYFIEYSNHHGEIKKKAKSISFAKMDNFEFSELYDKTIYVILKYILIGNTKQELEDEILENF